MGQVRVTRTVEEVGVDAQGKMQQQVRVEFMVGEDGPFMLRFPREGFRGADALRKCEEFAREIAELRR